MSFAAQRWFHHALLLTGGNILLTRGDGPATVAGPAVTFFPPSAEEVITVAAGSLGFRDPGNFSHFFKRKTGLSPARYRAMAIMKSSSAPIQTSSDYHDWP